MDKTAFKSLIRERIIKTLKESEDNNTPPLQTGDIVRIPPFLDSDPFNRGGQSGEVIFIDDKLQSVLILFKGGGQGIYSLDIFEASNTRENSSIDETSKEDIDNQKEYNKELEKTADITDRIKKERIEEILGINKSSKMKAKMRSILSQHYNIPEDKLTFFEFDGEDHLPDFANALKITTEQAKVAYEIIMNHTYKLYPELKEAKSKDEDEDVYDKEDKEPSKSAINKKDSVSNLANKLQKTNKELKTVVNKWKEATGAEKEKHLKRLKELTKVKKEIEKML